MRTLRRCDGSNSRRETGSPTACAALRALRNKQCANVSAAGRFSKDAGAFRAGDTGRGWDDSEVTGGSVLLDGHDGLASRVARRPIDQRLLDGDAVREASGAIEAIGSSRRTRAPRAVDLRTLHATELAMGPVSRDDARRSSRPPGHRTVRVSTGRSARHAAPERGRARGRDLDLGPSKAARTATDRRVLSPAQRTRGPTRCLTYNAPTYRSARRSRNQITPAWVHFLLRACEAYDKRRQG